MRTVEQQHSRLKALLPIIRYAESCPVYFDSHTLTVRGGHLSMYTMDGRIKFELLVSPQQRLLLATQRLQEITLSRGVDEKFMLTFIFEKHKAWTTERPDLSIVESSSADVRKLDLPAYVGLESGQ